MKSCCFQESSRSSSSSRIPSSLRIVLLVAILQLFSNSNTAVVSAYTCTFSGLVSHYGSRPALLCRHGTKSSSGVFDSRRITILYLQTEEGEEIDLSSATTVVPKIHHDNDVGGTTMQVILEKDDDDNNDDDASLLTKRQKLKRLLKRMRSVGPKLRICLPSFMARMKSIEAELNATSSSTTNNGAANGGLGVMDWDDVTLELKQLDLVELGDDDDEDVVQGEEEEEEEETEDRSVTAASHVDLSGTWRPIVTPHFKAEYDQYLQNCSQSFIFRKVIVNGISLQKETIRQLENGKDLQIVASNPAGNWNRTLVSSSSLDPLHVTMQDPDGDTVQVEAWWEDDGKVHKSWLRNKPRLMGGAFETSRYLHQEDPNILVCDSIFHPSPDAPASKG
eukprot:CAMPEP_0113623484 /NCGR_PEP_ID=MMETSP0017_2-20120614/12083_1 /TAXON_ID=2856 /ORGANISM="Cylindrotheca closterium" /LENGTH=391 /DNA_ID=CAMNT_0000533439 /DNA_START=262 /DNA_END=1433 /DNA_ORIENTATION=- /assembly_acc=CAM_ASM_000147